MKKTILLVLVSVVFVLSNTQSIQSQNLMINGDLEVWTTTTAPDGWYKAENVTQETTNVHGGVSSAAHMSTSSTKDMAQSITVTGGLTYTIKYYYLDNDANARHRIWAYWLAGSGTLPDNAAELRPSAYSVDNPDWQEYNVTLVAPAGADGFRFEVRVYNQDGNTGGMVYYDDFSVEQSGVVTPEINMAYAISDTELELLYNVDLTSVDPDDYGLSGTSSITFSGATIDGTNPKLVHLTGASTAMVGDITLDNINDDGNGTNLDFYAGILPIAYTNTNNPGGTMQNNYTATFQGIITANDAYNNVWVSESNLGYNGVLIYSNSFDALVNVGDEILFSAKRDVYNSLTELVSPELINTVSTGNPFTPTSISGSDIEENITVDTDPGEKWEGQLVTIENFVVESYVDYDYRCSWSDTEEIFYFHIGDNVDYQFNNITLSVGATYTSVTGVVDWSNGSSYYRINPRNQADVVPLVIVEPTQLAVVSVNGGSDPFENVDFEVTVQVQDEFGDPAFVDADVNFTLTTNGGTSGLVDFTVSSTINGTVALGTSEVILTGVNMAPSGTNVVITATDDNPSGLNPGNSDPFDVLELVIPDIIITEIMQNPDSVSDNNGEWYEVFNNTDSPVDMLGWIMKDNGSNEHTILTSLVVPAYGFAVLGNDDNPATNGGYTCDYMYDGFFLGNSDDEIILYLPDGITEVDRVEWDGGPIWPDPHGASMVYTGVPSEDNNNGAIWGQALSVESTYTNPDWDKGSPGTNGEYQVLTEGFSLDLKVFLEGYYEAGVGMNNYYRANNLLPLDQPYNPMIPYYGNNAPVWLYAGTESTNYLPYFTTDWILVELWDGFASGKVQHIAVVETDGQVGCHNGSARLSVKTEFFNDMYIAVYHLNHLGILSASGLTPIEGSVVSYDFSTGADKVTNGALGYKELEAGVWGMVAGDINGDGIVDGNDKSNGWAPGAGEEGTYQGNNLYQDEQINNMDKNEIWAPNMGISSQIPD